MKALSLYEMSDQYQTLMNNLYDYDAGTIDETALDNINALQDSIEDKCINITKVFKSLERTQETIKAERERLANRERAFKNQVARLKEYLQSNMEKCEIKKIECPEFSITLQKNPVAVEITNENAVPVEYDKPQKRELDIARIRNELQCGVIVPGATLVQRNSVRIR